VRHNMQAVSPAVRSDFGALLALALIVLLFFAA
jgi:hypothetical protein